MDARTPPEIIRLTQAESELLARRRRGRNIATLIVLLAIAALFYAVAMVKLARPGFGL